LKDVSLSLGCIWGVSAELRMPTHKGEVPGPPIVLAGWGYPCANFLGSDVVVLWGLRVQCGRVKLFSSSLGSMWGEGSVPNYGCLSIRGRVPGLPIVLPGWGDPCANFFGVRCGSCLGFAGPVR